MHLQRTVLDSERVVTDSRSELLRYYVSVACREVFRLCSKGTSRQELCYAFLAGVITTLKLDPTGPLPSS